MQVVMASDKPVYRMLNMKAHGQMDFKMDTEPRLTPTEEFTKVNGPVECDMVMVSVSQSLMVSLPWSTTR